MGLAYLDGVVKRLKGQPASGVTRLVAEGEVRDVIRAQAECVHADLVVMTTHGRGPLGRFWLGSVADELVRTLPMPVLLVRPGEAAPDLDHEATLEAHPDRAGRLAAGRTDPGAGGRTGRLDGGGIHPGPRRAAGRDRRVRPGRGGLRPLAVGVEQLEAEHKRRCEQAEKYLEDDGGPAAGAEADRADARGRPTSNRRSASCERRRRRTPT